MFADKDLSGNSWEALTAVSDITSDASSTSDSKDETPD
jgi:hypothetical protein